MRRTLSVFLTALALPWLPGAIGGVIPPGYTVTDLTAGLNPSDVKGISQLAFMPGDPNHIYADRWPSAQQGGVVTRYDFNPQTGAISNPVTVASGLGGGNGLSVGIAFLGDDLYVTQANFNTLTGGITRFTAPDSNGVYQNRVDFINNVPILGHVLGQIQIVGNSLYVGIGTRTNTGTSETVYNGTIAKIDDLTKANYSANGADNLALANVLTDTDPGKLHVYATNLRNAFGLRVSPAGEVTASVNGANPPDVSPDLFYTNIKPGDRGIYPPPGSGATIQPLATLGPDLGATGFSPLTFGPQAGAILVGAVAPGNGQPGTLEGSGLLAVDPTTGAVSSFLSDFANVTDVLPSPSGGLLFTDFGFRPDQGAELDTPGGIFLLTAAPVPEPTSLALLGLGTAAGLAARIRRRRVGSIA
jgi:glucose/arabinose dehydrogenase